MVAVRLGRAIPAKICIVIRCVFNSSNSFGISSLGEGMLSTECHSSLKSFSASNTPFNFSGDRDDDPNSFFLPPFLLVIQVLCAYSIGSPITCHIYSITLCRVCIHISGSRGGLRQNHRRCKARRHLANQTKIHDYLKRRRRYLHLLAVKLLFACSSLLSTSLTPKIVQFFNLGIQSCLSQSSYLFLEVGTAGTNP